MSFETLLILALMMAGFSVKPGPGMIAFASRAISPRGMKGVAALMLGNAPVKALFLFLAVFGYSKLGDLQLFVMILIKSLAAVYLIYLGIRGFMTETKNVEKRLDSDGGSLKDDFIAGFIITLTNPFDIIIFAGVIPGLIALNEIGVSEFWAIYAALMLAYIGVVLSYTIPLSLGRKFISQDKAVWLDRIANAAFILIGLIIGFSAIFSSQILPP